MLRTQRLAGGSPYFGPLADRVRTARRAAGLSQAGLAKIVGVGASAVAQWEIPNGTSPTMEHLVRIATHCSISFEWLATGRGAISVKGMEIPAVDSGVFAADLVEERLLIAFRRVPRKKRELLVRWLEEFF